MDQCTISGTEVFHRRCVVNIEDSIGNRRQRQVLELTQALERAGRTIRQLERSAQQATRASAATAAEMTAALARSETALAQSAADAAARARLHEQELAQLRSERDIARAEATIARSTHEVATPDSTPELDDAETRFSLLEFDR